MRRLKQVALAFPVIASELPKTVVAIRDYAREHGNWNFTGNPDTMFASMQELEGWPGDGVIAELFTEKGARVARRLGVPVVNLSGTLADPGVPSVLTDSYLVGRLAAEELLGCHLRRFVFYGVVGAEFSRQRGQGFVDRLEEEGLGAEVWEAPGGLGRRGTWHQGYSQLRTWLHDIVPPTGIMAAHDNRARMLADVCSELGLRVPQDVAIIGANHYRTACELYAPTLSTVALDSVEIGRRAAMLLDRLMAGKQPPEKPVRIPPGRVIRRESTDLVAAEEPDLSRAVRFIHEHCGEVMTVADVLAEVSVSRRWLEQRFNEYFDCTPHEYICRLRVQRVKELLTSAGNLPYHEIARRCGFSGTRRMRLVFQRLTGQTPAQYREAKSKNDGNS